MYGKEYYVAQYKRVYCNFHLSLKIYANIPVFRRKLLKDSLEELKELNIRFAYYNVVLFDTYKKYRELIIDMYEEVTNEKVVYR